MNELNGVEMRRQKGLGRTRAKKDEAIGENYVEVGYGEEEEEEYAWERDVMGYANEAEGKEARS